MPTSKSHLRPAGHGRARPSEKRIHRDHVRYSGSISGRAAKGIDCLDRERGIRGHPASADRGALVCDDPGANVDREIQPSDTTDIKVLSAYAPYMDVVCTDAFMAEQLHGFAKEYGVTVFHGKTNSLRNMKAFLEQHLKNATPVRRP